MTMLYLPQDQLKDGAIEALRAKLRAGLPEIAGVKLSVGERMWWRNQGSKDGTRVSIELHGEDPEYLEQVAVDVVSRVEVIPGAIEALGTAANGRREVRVHVDPDLAHEFGITPETVSKVIGFAYRGRRLRRFRGSRGELEMVLGLLPGDLRGLQALRGLPVPGPDGKTVPLESLGSIEFARTHGTIERVDRLTSTWVSVRFDSEVTTDEAMKRVRDRLASLALPNGYHWDFGTWGRDRDDTLNTMMKGVGLSLLVVGLLLIALFESFTQPLAIVVTLPLAFFGAFWSLWLGGYGLDTVAFIGLIVLIGIVVNNGIVMVDHVNALRRSGQDRVPALLAGCGNRLRPILMTAITTVVGLVPLATSGSTIAGAYLDSLAVAVIGGLASSTIFTLLALPVWYTVVEDVGSLAARLLPRLERADDGHKRAFPKRAVMIDTRP
jgi:HAE1 family hydrophobic/amphiphilic exporter-1